MNSRRTSCRYSISHRPLQYMIGVLLLILFLNVGAVPSIYLIEPRNVDFSLQGGVSVIGINVQYQLFNHQPSDGPMQFCYDLFNLFSNTNVYEGVCVGLEVTAFAIPNLSRGKYMMTSYLMKMTDTLNEVIPETKIVNHFTVESHEDALPKLRLLSNDNQLDFMIANEQINATDVSFEYTITESTIPASNYQVCVFIGVAGTTDVVLPRTCLDTSQRVLSLNNVKKGSYNVELVLKDLHSGSIEDSTKLMIPLSVKPLVDLLPMIHVVDSPSEYMLDADTGVAEVSLKYVLEGNPVAVSRVRTCLSIDKLDASEDQTVRRVPLLDRTCVPREHNVFTLSRMTEGKYSAMLTLQNEQIPTVFYDSRDLEVKLEIRAAEEFSPSYEWRTIHAWNTIPAGIVTRLPLSGTASKEGRISDPWKLQLAMPYPCKYFLRMDLRRDTTLMEIKRKASDKCKLPPECFLLYGDNELLLDGEMTVESSNYFNLARRLELDTETCSTLIEASRNQ